MKLFNSNYFEKLVNQAKNNPRGRQHCNIHHSYEEPCQRLFNAIEPGSYIRPHRHTTDPRQELLIAICGSMVLFTFDDGGGVARVIPLGTSKDELATSVGVEISSDTWHTVIALESRSVLLEVKAGPFNSSQSKDFAPWSPEEGTIHAKDFLDGLVELSKSIKG